MNAFDTKVKELREQGLNSDQILEKLSQLFEEKNSSSETATKKIKKVLNYVCIPTGLIGYKYWVEAIRIIKFEGGELNLDKNIYPQIAQKFQVTTYSVERNMRQAKERAVELWNKEHVQYLFGIIANDSTFRNAKKIKTRSLLTILANKIS